MGKRSTGKKRGIQRGVAKHKIRSKPLAANFAGEWKVLGLKESVYFLLGKRCFDFWFYWSEKLYLAPFTRTATGQYVPLDRGSKLAHNFAWFLMFLILLHKSWGLAVILLYEELKVETFMCISHFLACFIPFCISFGTILRPQETMDLLNSWPHILSCLKELRKNVPSPFDDVSLACKLMAVLVVTQGAAASAALFSLAFSSLPTTYFCTAERLGLVPEGLLRRFLWQLIFFPLECATYFPPMIIASLSGSIILIIVGIYRIYTMELK